MESKNELKEIDIKNRLCYCFDDIIRFCDKDIEFSDILLAEKSYETSENIAYQTVCYYHVMYEFQSESTLYSLPECLGTPCSKQAPYLKFN